jgi:putative ABC transport system permease protein
VSTGLGVLVGAGLRGRRRWGLAATVLVLLIAAIGIAAGLEVSRQGAPILDAAADKANVAHLVLKGDPDVVAAVAADPEVVAWSGPFATIDDVELVTPDDTVPMEVAAIDDPDLEVNRPPITEGRWASAPDEIVLDRSLATDLGIDVGGTVTLRTGGVDTVRRVVGTAVNFTDCFYPQCDPGRAWVTGAGLAPLAADGSVYAQGFLRFADAAEADPFVERQAAAGVEGIGSTESWLDTREDFLTLDRVFGSFVSAFGMFVLAVAAVIVAGSTAMRVVTRRREIGLLGAVGCTPRQVSAALLVENLLVGAAAGIAGWFLAGFLVPSLQLGIGRTFGAQDPSWSPVALAVCMVANSVLLVVATIAPAVSAARRPVTDVVRDVPRDRVSWLNRRVAGVPRRLSLLGVREAVSRPTSGAFAALAVVVAVVGTLVSIGFVKGIDAVAADPARAGDPWDVAVVRGDVPPATVEGVLGQTAGVASWFTDVERRSTFQGGAFLSVATGGDPAAAAYQIASGLPLTREGEAIAGYGFLQRFGVRVGDRIEVLVGTTPLTLTIVGEYRDTEDSGEILRYRFEDLARLEPGLAPRVYRVTAAAGTTPAALAADLTATLGPGVRVAVLDTGVGDMGPLMAVLQLIAVVLVVMAGTNLLSTLLTATRESAGRVGVQLAVGFTPRQIVGQGAMAGAVTGAVAAAVGVPLGLLVFRVLADGVSAGIGVGPGWMPSPPAMAVVLVPLAAVLLAAALGAAAVARTARRPASDLVRGE